MIRDLIPQHSLNIQKLLNLTKASPFGSLRAAKPIIHQVEINNTLLNNTNTNKLFCLVLRYLISQHLFS